MELRGCVKRETNQNMKKKKKKKMAAIAVSMHHAESTLDQVVGYDPTTWSNVLSAFRESKQMHSKFIFRLGA